MHGCDIFQGVHALLNQFNAKYLFNDLEIFSLLTASIAHDVGHNG